MRFARVPKAQQNRRYVRGRPRLRGAQQDEIMGEILGLGITHYPGLTVQGNLCRRIKMCQADSALPERLRSIEN